MNEMEEKIDLLKRIVKTLFASLLFAMIPATVKAFLLPDWEWLSYTFLVISIFASGLFSYMMAKKVFLKDYYTDAILWKRCLFYLIAIVGLLPTYMVLTHEPYDYKTDILVAKYDQELSRIVYDHYTVKPKQVFSIDLAGKSIRFKTTKGYYVVNLSDDTLALYKEFYTKNMNPELQTIVLPGSYAKTEPIDDYGFRLFGARQGHYVAISHKPERIVITKYTKQS